MRNEVVVYRDLLMVNYEPGVSRAELSLLFSSSFGDRIRNVFCPGYVEIGRQMSVRNGHRVENNFTIYERGWVFNRLVEKNELVVGKITYTLYTYEVQFTRNRESAIPHRVEDRFVLVPYKDVHALHPGGVETQHELSWGYISEEKLRGVLEDMKKLDSMHA